MSMPPELRDLMQRYCQLGRLLPQPIEDVSFEDPRERAEIALVIKEMERVKAEIDAFLDAARQRPRFSDTSERAKPLSGRTVRAAASRLSPPLAKARSTRSQNRRSIAISRAWV